MTSRSDFLISTNLKSAFSPKNSQKKFLINELSFKRKNAVKTDAKREIRKAGMFFANSSINELNSKRIFEIPLENASKIAEKNLFDETADIFLEIKGIVSEKALLFCVSVTTSRKRCVKRIFKMKNTATEIVKSDSTAENEGGIILFNCLFSGFAARNSKYPNKNGAEMEKI